MGIYGEYLDRKFNFPALATERKSQLAKLVQLRNRDVLVYAADINQANAPNGVDYGDLLPVHDQLENLSGTKGVDLILETPGGAGEIAEEIVRMLRDRYEDVSVIVPGCAKSAGTIMAMAADDILMGPLSALGPIDAQIAWQGKVFSADAFIEGLEKIKQEVTKTGSLNKAYIPVLQAISPGEIEHAQNALDFAKDLVTDWLTRFKFKNWTTHSSTGKPVTDQERAGRAKEIAKALCNQKKWRTHGRSIKISDLEKLRLKITDYSKQTELYDAIHRYYTLLRMTFETNIYKVFETPTSQVYRFIQPGGAMPVMQEAQPDQAIAVMETGCPQCGARLRIQANIGAAQPLEPGCVPFPKDNRLPCPNCGAIVDLTTHRAQVEAQAGQPIVT
ncbi:MAG: ATP-dependent Clp protease proteolytic subunit [Planctomycetes bacterium]|nr:ATP-dependent Clp protease proteolytic subunit [Planctomycetota bacterium]